MDFIGVYLGDGDNAERLTLKVAAPPELQWRPFEEMFRTITGSLIRNVIKGLIPAVSLSLKSVPETTMGILRAARIARQELTLYYGRGWEIKRQDELLVGTNYLILMPSSLAGLSDFKVYLKSDFTGATNYFQSYNAITRLITLSTTLTVGAPVYVDYKFSQIKCVLTGLRERPHAGALRKWYEADVTFEGV